MKNVNSEIELFRKVMPALRTKKNEMIRVGIRIVNEKDIWNYNKNNKWKRITGLTLANMVDDILNTDNTIYYEYKLARMKESE